MSTRSTKSYLNQMLLGGMIIATSVYIKTAQRENTSLPVLFTIKPDIYRIVLFVLGLILVFHSLFVQFQTGQLTLNITTILSLLGSLSIFLGMYLVKSFVPNENSDFEANLKEYGGFFFTFGWLAVAYSVSLNSGSPTDLLSIFTLVGILSSMAYILSNGSSINSSSMILFALAWVALTVGIYV